MGAAEQVHLSEVPAVEVIQKRLSGGLRLPLAELVVLKELDE
jgi:hypothetical protein